MVKLSFIGDIAFNDDYIHLKNKGINPFVHISPLLTDSDLVIGNLECTLKGDEGENLLKKPRIRTLPDALMYVKDIHLGLATLATNHIYDNLTDGFRKTVNFLESNSISYIGAGDQSERARQKYIYRIKDITFCFLNYITTDTHPSLPADAGVHLNIFDEEKCINDLREAADYDYRIVLMHWGGRFEGGLFPDFDQISLSRRIIDSGADLIIGHHSHTLQPYDVYKGKYVFYSLGNFCFSDIRFEGKIRNMSSLRERESLILNVEFSKSGYRVDWIPFRNEKLSPVIRRFVGFKFFVRNISWKFIKRKPLWILYNWWYRNIRPVMVQLCRKDENKSLIQRIFHHLLRKRD